MKKIIVTFLKVSGLSMIGGWAIFFFLLLLFSNATNENVSNEIIIPIIIFALLGGLTVTFIFIFLYLPIYYLQKINFEKESILVLFDTYLPIVLIPITVVYSIFIISDPRLFNDSEFIMTFLDGYFLCCFGFWLFIKFIKE
jgi:hypothetical protein